MIHVLKIMKPKTELEKLQVLKLIQCVQDDKFKDIKRLWKTEFQAY